jgi:Ca2+/H+ antiporter
VLLSSLIGPLALSFPQVEIATLAASIVFTVAVLYHGHTSRLRGGALLVAYGGVVVAFFLAGDRTF